MLFNSFAFFAIFLPISMLGYQLAGYAGRRAVLLWLSFASLVFYGMWNRHYTVLLLGSVVANYGLSRLIAGTAPESVLRKRYLVTAIVLNLSALFYYKYLFSCLSLVSDTYLYHALGLNTPHPVLLPLGISFFTFTQIAYLVDLAQNQAEREDFAGYVVFVTFFPHLIAGPLLHHREIMPQFQESAGQASRRGRRFQLRAADVSFGMSLFIFGLAKKVLIADKLAPAADAAFTPASSAGACDAWAGLLIYCMQLYFDFSGYSDMAIGIARCFGIQFPWNFNSPWKATSVTEYWQRWHMTLTRYVTLYLYNPILLSIQRRRIRSGRKVSRKSLHTPEGFVHMVFVPLMTTMLLTGLWHGAGLQFLIFGALHGFYLSAHQAWKHFVPSGSGANETEEDPSSAGQILMRTGVFLQVAFALIFFRAASLPGSFQYLGDLFGKHGAGSLSYPITSLIALGLLLACWYLPNTQQILTSESPKGHRGWIVSALQWNPGLPWAVFLGVLLFAVMANLDGASSFLYFQF